MAVGLRKDITLKTTHQFLSALFGEDIHAKRVYSLANATLGVISSASLAVNSIGQGLALARGRLPKHAIKQVDRLLSNPGIDVDEISKRWVAHDLLAVSGFRSADRNGPDRQPTRSRDSETGALLNCSPRHLHKDVAG